MVGIVGNAVGVSVKMGFVGHIVGTGVGSGVGGVGGVGGTGGGVGPVVGMLSSFSRHVSMWTILQGWSLRHGTVVGSASEQPTRELQKE